MQDITCALVGTAQARTVGTFAAGATAGAATAEVT